MYDPVSDHMLQKQKRIKTVPGNECYYNKDLIRMTLALESGSRQKLGRLERNIKVERAVRKQLLEMRAIKRKSLDILKSAKFI